MSVHVAVVDSSPPSFVGDGGLDAVHAGLLRGRVPFERALQSVGVVPPGFDADMFTLDPLNCLDYLEKLDATHHLLAELGGMRPRFWPYPEHHPRPPSYQPQPGAEPHLVVSQGRRMRARQAAQDLEGVTSHGTWQRVLRRAQLLRFRAPTRLDAVCVHVTAVLQLLVASRQAGAANGFTAAQTRRGKKAAQLVFALAVLRGRHGLAARALAHYASFAGDELDAPAAAAPTYEAHPLGAADLNAWLATCPSAVLAKVDVWHPGLRTAVDAQTISTLFSRLQPQLVGWAPAERVLMAAARRGRLPDATWTRAFVAALVPARCAQRADAERHAAALLRSGLLVRTARLHEPWPHLPLTVDAVGEGSLAARARRQQSYAVAARELDTLSVADIVQLIAEAEAAGEARLLREVVHVNATPFADPFLGFALLRVLAHANDAATCCAIFTRMRLNALDDLDGQVVTGLFVSCFRGDSWPLLAKLLSFLDARGLAYHTHVTQALEDVRTRYARRLSRDGQRTLCGHEEAALQRLTSPAAALMAWRCGDAPFEADAGAPTKRGDRIN